MLHTTPTFHFKPSGTDNYVRYIISVTSMNDKVNLIGNDRQ